jgi:D-tyrosyl-tRNA(Tyr) deacylase
MKIVVQRVSEAHVSVGEETVGRIGKGVVVFLGIAKDDTEEDAGHLVSKLTQLRMFDDEAGNLNLSSREVGASFLIVSQFTIYGDCRKGRRPSFDRAAAPQKAETLYNYFVGKLRAMNVTVKTGVFRAMMKVHLVNDGPVTLILET